jgi:hypothetical protein
LDAPPAPEGPSAWIEWRCPSCRSVFAGGPACPVDQVPLQRIVCSSQACSLPLTEPGGWWTEWTCSLCGRPYAHHMRCPEHGIPLDRSSFSCPFLWLG